MNILLEQNSSCADCEAAEVVCVNLRFGVFLCESCGRAHKTMNFPVCLTSATLTQDQMQMLATQGNTKVNADLLQYVPPWAVTPREFPIDFIRLFYVENKYINLAFANDLYLKYKSFALGKYWFYLDESTFPTPLVRGPLSRDSLLELVDKGFLTAYSYLWHPVIGKSWLPVEKVIYILKPPDSIDDAAVYEACHKKLTLVDLPYPHLRGYVNLTHRMRTFQQWLVLLDHKIGVFTQNSSPSPNYEIPIESLEMGLKLQGSSLYIELVDGLNEWFIHSTPPEVIEWFQAIKCIQHLIHNVGEDLQVPAFDPSEFHICNLKSSKDYLGNKIVDGYLKKSGSAIWTGRRTRWFILRTVGLFFYLNPGDKVAQGELRITKDSRVEDLADGEEGFAVFTKDKFLHLWANSAKERELWTSALKTLIETAKSSAAHYSSVQTVKETDWIN